jgi:addiction module HigA family antidote
MIRDFANPQTARLAAGQRNRRWPPDMQVKAFKQLTTMHAVEHWTELRNPPATIYIPCLAIGPANLLFASTCSGGACSRRSMTERCAMSNSPTITDTVGIGSPEDWLPNPHAGEVLASEFMEPLGLSATDLATKIGVTAARVAAVVDGHEPMGGELDLRLARYFGMSEGFFLRLQDSYELLEAKGALNGELDRIVPRAA